MITVTTENYEQVKREMSYFVNSEIAGYCRKAGSREALSVRLGHAENYVRLIMNRGSFSALERLWKECQSKYNGESK